MVEGVPAPDLRETADIWFDTGRDPVVTWDAEDRTFHLVRPCEPRRTAWCSSLHNAQWTTPATWPECWQRGSPPATSRRPVMVPADPTSNAPCGRRASTPTPCEWSVARGVHQRTPRATLRPGSANPAERDQLPVDALMPFRVGRWTGSR
jgi:hypothetical protein